MIIQYQNTLDDYREMTDGIAAIRKPVNGPIQIFILMAVFGVYYVITRFLWQKAGDADGHLAAVNMWIAFVAFGFTWLAISLPASLRSRRFPWLTGRQWVSVCTFIVLIAALIFQHWMNRKLYPNGHHDELSWQTFLPHSVWLVFLVYGGAVGAHNQSTKLTRHWEARPDLHRHQTIEITAEGVHFSDTVAKSEYQWAAFLKSEETRHLILLFTAENNAIMIPKRSFDWPQDLSAMRNLLKLIPRTQFRGFPVNMNVDANLSAADQRGEGMVVAESA